MKRTIAWIWAACALAAGAAAADGEALASVAEGPAWEGEAKEAVEEGVRLLEENRLVPDMDRARRAIVEALVLAAEPSAVFLDKDASDARTKHAGEAGWDVGLALAATEGLPKVAGVRKGSPADAAGIVAGDRIAKAGEEEMTAGDGLEKARKALQSDGEPALEIELQGEDGKVRSATVERARRGDAGLEVVEDLPANMGYMKAAGIVPGTGDEIVAALAKWREAGFGGAILDLRGAGGAASEEIARVAARHAPAEWGLYETSDRSGGEKHLAKVEAAEPFGLPLMVLVDEGTTGASELLAAVLAGSAKGVMVIGRETSGDPLIRKPVEMADGRCAWVATRQVAVADGTVYAGLGGVVPDVEITDAALNETAYEPETMATRRGKSETEEERIDKELRDRIRHDTYLRRATDVLLGLQALGYGANR